MRKAIKKIVQCITIVVSICVFFSFSIPVMPISATRLLTMQQAVQLGKASSEALYQLDKKLYKKNIDLVQARQGIKDIRKKESTIRFSLLLSIKFPEKHGMPKEIQLVTKIPIVMTEINDLKKKIEFTRNKVEADVRTGYLNIVSEIFNVEMWQKTLNEENAAYKMLQKKYKTGQAKAEQVSKKGEEIEAIRQALQKAILNFENNKRKLSDQIGMDVTYGYAFERNFITAYVNRQDLEGIMGNSREKSFELYLAASKKNLSISKVEMIRNIYRNQFGSKTSGIEAELNRSGKLDFDKFMQKYEQMLVNIDRPWQGNFYLLFYFFIIPIPKEWFMGEFTALRYFEDEKYALPSAVQEREADIKAYDQALKEHDGAAMDGYQALKEMENAFVSSVKLYNRSLEDFEKSLKMNQHGLLSFEELDAVKKQVRGNAVTAVNNLLSYNKQIHAYNFQTGGAMNPFMGGTKIEIGSLEEGISFVKEEKKPEKKAPEEKPTSVAMWFIDTSNTDYKVFFRVQLPKSIQATHFALFTSQKRQIGTKVKITDRISHLPMLFSDTSMLTVEFYQNDKMIGKATVDGFDIQGELKIQFVEEKQNAILEEALKGTWKAVPNQVGLLSEFSIGLNPVLEVSHYELYTKEGEMIGQRKETADILLHLSSVFSNVDGMTLKLYKGEELFAYAVLNTDATLDLTVVKE